MSFADKIGAVFSRKRLAILTGVVLLYGFWIYGVSTNPPGFYVDESCIAYNGYSIATTGAQEDGKVFPLYIHCYTQGYSQYMSATQPYVLALVYLFIPPSVSSARITAATTVFLAILLLGYLAARISKNSSVGIIVALSGMATPWLFDFSRLVMELFFLTFAVVLFLFCLYNAYERGRWKITDCLSIAISLTLITFSYASGRALAPILALGLLFFAVSWRALFDVGKVWVIYALTMIPLLVVYYREPLVVSGRFWRTTNISMNKSFFENLAVVAWALVQDFSPNYLVIQGDVYLRHHIAGTGQLLVATFALGILGIVIILMRHRSSPWWRYIIFGLPVSLFPGAITSDRHSSIRGLSFAVFFLLLTVPAISWLLGLYKDKTANAPDLASDGAETVQGWSLRRVFENLRSPAVERNLRLGLLSALLLLTAVQAIQFQIRFRDPEIVKSKEGMFNVGYPRILDLALQDGSRPIYLKDQGEPAYMHAFWYGAIKGLDRSNFVHLLDRQNAPEGALVLSSGPACPRCDVIAEDGGYTLYRNGMPEGSTAGTEHGPQSGAPTVFTAETGPLPGQLQNPRGIATDAKGNLYIADTGNARIQKFDAEGKLLLEFGNTGSPLMVLREPYGIAVDSDGAIYVVDASSHKLIKFGPDGISIARYDGADSGFYGPRDVAIGPNRQLYIVDQGRARIARFDPATESYSMVWGSAGSGEGQFIEPTGITVADNLVFVADRGNGRIQVFDLDGKFVRQWPMPSWQRSAVEFPDVAVDSEKKTVYVTNNFSDEVLMFDLNGNALGSVDRAGEDKLETPSSLATVSLKGMRKLYVLSSGRGRVFTIELEPLKKVKEGKGGPK